ncbi:MAG: PAS domain S-box protein, partial [Desulfatiglandaceae bacterium]
MVQVNLRDVTERKRMAEAYENERAYLSAVIDNIGEAIVICDAEGRIVRFNETARRLHGLPEQSIPSDLWAEHYSLYQQDGITPLPTEDIPLFRALQGECVKDVEIVVAPKHSRPYFLVCNGQALTDETTGKIYGAVVAMYDITERKQAEDAIRASEEKYRSILEEIEDGYFEVDLAGNFTFFNDSMCRILGYSSDELMGMNNRAFIDTENADKVYNAFNQVFTSCKPLKAFDWELIKKDGEKCYVDTSVSLIKNANGEAIGFRGIARNITERKQAETYREMGREILQILHEPGHLQESIQRVLAVLKTRTGVDAVGLRLQEGEDFPYFVQEGFSKDFLLTENTLLERGKDGGVCRDKDGNVHLECTCGLVISGKTDPSNPLFTKGGSSWTNDSFPLLDLPSDQDPRLHPRNNCIHQGYASVALIPIRIQNQMYSRETCIRHGFSSMAQVPVRTSDQIVGLIQLNDKRKGRFSLETIEILEGIAAHVGSALMRKQSEEDLEKSFSLIDATMNSLEEGLLIVNMEGKIIIHNRAFLDLWKIPPELESSSDEMLLEHVVSQLVDPVAFLSKVRQLYDEPEESSFDEIAFADGRVFERYSQPQWQGSQITGRVWCFRDITERKQAEQELRASEEKYRRIAENITDVVWTMDLNLNPTFVSSSIRKLLGETPEEHMRRTMAEKYPPVYLDKIYQMLAEELEKENDPAIDKARSRLIEVEHYKADGFTIWVSMNISAIRDEYGNLVGLQGVARDITEQKKQEEKQKKLQAQLNQAQKMESVGRLAGGVAHDFNNMLTIINGYAEMMADVLPSSDPMYESVQEIQDAGKRSAVIVRKLLAFARKQTIAPVPMNLNDSVSGMLKMLHRLIGENIDLLWNPGKNTWPVKMDHSQLDQILANLVVNARDA